MRILKRFLPLSASPNPQIELLSRPGCHLCDEALDALAPVFGRDAIIVTDITQEPSLEAEFVFRIPVVRYREAVIAEGAIDSTVARRARKKANRLVREEPSPA